MSKPTMQPTGSVGEPPRGRERFKCVRCGSDRPVGRLSMFCAPCDELPIDTLPLFAPTEGEP